jgi:hypothetical protein
VVVFSAQWAFSNYERNIYMQFLGLSPQRCWAGRQTPIHTCVLHGRLTARSRHTHGTLTVRSRSGEAFGRCTWLYKLLTAPSLGTARKFRKVVRSTVKSIWPAVDRPCSINRAWTLRSHVRIPLRVLMLIHAFVMPFKSRCTDTQEWRKLHNEELHNLY